MLDQYVWAPAMGLYRHRRTVAAMGALAISGLRSRVKGRHVQVPSNLEAVSATTGDLPAFDRVLGAQFMRVTQADPAHYTGLVPPTYYVTWGMRALVDGVLKLGMPYNYSRGLHAASEVKLVRPLKVDEPARYHGRVVSVDDNEHRARITMLTVVSDPAGAEIFRNTMELHVPKKANKEGKPGPSRVVPASMSALKELQLDRHLGRRYALVSGDFNPIHWSTAAAKTLGFKTVLIQGFCLKALIAHTLVAQELGGNYGKLAGLRVEFRQPLYLPARATLFLGPPERQADGTSKRALAVGQAAGAEVNVSGEATVRA